MKLQFGTSTALLFVTCVAIALGGSIGWVRLADATNDPVGVLNLIALLSPFFVPVVFTAYAIGRRRLTVVMVVGFAIAQAAVVAFAWIVKEYR
jgi:uncharacterized membrane protein